MDFVIPTDHSVKLKESQKRDEYLDLAKEMKKKLWNMKVTVIPVVIGALGTATKWLVQGLEDLVSWFLGFYGISTFVGYLMPNPFLCK